MIASIMAKSSSSLFRRFNSCWLMLIMLYFLTKLLLVRQDNNFDNFWRKTAGKYGKSEKMPVFLHVSCSFRVHSPLPRTCDWHDALAVQSWTGTEPHSPCTVDVSRRRCQSIDRLYMTVPNVLRSISAFDRARASRSRAPASAFREQLFDAIQHPPSKPV